LMGCIHAYSGIACNFSQSSLSERDITRCLCCIVVKFNGILSTAIIMSRLLY
jgi:hypothetical protein